MSHPKNQGLFSFLNWILGMSASSALAQNPNKPLVLPVRYDEHRFYVQPVTAEGVRLNFFTDTGGGLFLFSDVVEKLKLTLTKTELAEGTSEIVALPKFKQNATIPTPLGNNERLFIVPAKDRSALSQDWSGMLGQKWFADRAWTFDYIHRQLLLRSSGDLPKQAEEHKVTLGFQRNALGKRKNHFPRIEVAINGEKIDLLFDTGASTQLSEMALTTLNDKRPAIRATSFIAASIFEKWHTQHPEWRVIEKAEQGSKEAMIEVPEITVAGYTVGPIWFTRRADKNFHEYMSQWMDKRVEGALGGNALRFFRITVDYPLAVALFEK
jgi:hypothetical protein